MIPQAGQALSALVDAKRPLLTRRENEVLDCMLSGWNHRETADELDITEQSAKNYARNVMRLMGIPRNTQFRVWVREQSA